MTPRVRRRRPLPSLTRAGADTTIAHAPHGHRRGAARSAPCCSCPVSARRPSSGPRSTSSTRARGMVETGDWLVPHYRGEPFFDKPALAYWLMAASMSVAGRRPRPRDGSCPRWPRSACWPRRCGSGRCVVGARAAACGALALATTVGFVSFGRLAMSDMLMTLWCTLAVAIGVRVFAAPPSRWAAAALGAALGLGFLTKGPVAVLLPGFALVLLAVEARREGRAWPPPSRVALAAAVFAPIALGWFVMVAPAPGPGAPALVLPEREPPALRRRHLRYGPARLVLRRGVPRPRTAVVAAAPAGPLPRVARARPAAAFPARLGGADGGAAEPVARQARLLPAAAAARAFAGGRAVPGRGLVDRGRTRRRARVARCDRGGAAAASRRARRRCRPSGCPPPPCGAPPPPAAAGAAALCVWAAVRVRPARTMGALAAVVGGAGAGAGRLLCAGLHGRPAPASAGRGGPPGAGVPSRRPAGDVRPIPPACSAPCCSRRGAPGRSAATCGRPWRRRRRCSSSTRRSSSRWARRSARFRGTPTCPPTP